MAIFGYNVKGGSAITSNTAAYKCLFPLTENGTVTKLTVYANNTATGARDLDLGIYTALAKTVSLIISVPALYDDWIDADIADTLLAAGTYGLGFKWKGIGIKRCYYTAGDVNQMQADTGLASGDNLPDPFVVDNNYDNKLSMYATYTAIPAGGISIPVAMHHYTEQRNHISDFMRKPHVIPKTINSRHC